MQFPQTLQSSRVQQLRIVWAEPCTRLQNNMPPNIDIENYDEFFREEFRDCWRGRYKSVNALLQAVKALGTDCDGPQGTRC